jgi:hypothetical protein
MTSAMPQTFANPTVDVARGLEAELARGLEAELARLGVPDPAVEVRLVDHLERQATGKVRRFLPLASVAVSLPA